VFLRVRLEGVLALHIVWILHARITTDKSAISVGVSSVGVIGVRVRLPKHVRLKRFSLIHLHVVGVVVETDVVQLQICTLIYLCFFFLAHFVIIVVCILDRNVGRKLRGGHVKGTVFRIY